MSNRARRRRVAAVDRVGEVMRSAHDRGELVCSRCGHDISPNEVSMSLEVGPMEVLVSCFECLPDLVETFGLLGAPELPAPWGSSRPVPTELDSRRDRQAPRG